MDEKKITRLILDFPHGASAKECSDISYMAQSIVMASVSEGGFMPTNKYGLNVDDVTWSEDTMNYVFGYNRNQEGKATCPPHSWNSDGEKCTKCGIKDWMT